MNPANWRTSTWSALNRIGAIRVTAIVLRASHRCAWCGVRPPKGRRHIDHIVPRSEGGSDDASNLTLACEDCNLGRRDDEIPDKAVRHGRTQAEINAELKRQAAISIEPGGELYERAKTIAPLWYPEHFARKARARKAYCERRAFERWAA